VRNRPHLTEREAEWVAEAARDELTGEIQREIGCRLTLEQHIAVDRAIERYRLAIWQLGGE
jgi:hypothetical protein